MLKKPVGQSPGAAASLNILAPNNSTGLNATGNGSSIANGSGAAMSDAELRLSEYYGPVISVLGTPEAECLLSKSNNLSPAELLQPFSTIPSSITLKDPEGAHHTIPSLSISFRDFKKDPHRLIGSKLISDSVSALEDESFKAFQTLFLASIPTAEHEYLRSELAILLVASAAEKDPLTSLKSLRSSIIEPHLRKKTDYPQFAFEEPWIAYLIIGDTEATPEYYQTLPSYAHYVRINTRTQPPSVHPWFSTSTSLKFCDLHSRHKGLGFTTLATTTNASLLVAPPPPQPNNNSSVDHPLARDIDDSVEDKSKNKLVPATPDNVALLLGEQDFESIRKFIREFAIRGLVPFVEKQMRTLHEVATNRKSRSLFSGAKRWFGQGKPGSSSGTSVVYGKEAPELLVRKLADLYFMFKLYKHAYGCYHSIKKDFQSDEAWNYYAGAAEMSALSSFMQFVNVQDFNAKKYPTHYMEDAILKYQQVCQMPDFALRATLFDALCLRHLGMYEESAKSYIRMTTDAKDLRSSLLLEQAALCYFKCKPPLTRKYAFYIILAAFKYSKSGQKKHSSRAYEKGYEVYKGHNWNLSEDHILYNLGHLALLLKDHSAAASLFNELFKMTLPVVNPLQQMCHLREFFIVQHLREKEDKKVCDIPIPKFIPQELVLDLNNDRTTRYESLIHSNPKTEWQDLEKVIIEHIGHVDNVTFSKSCQSVYGPKSANNLIPQGTVDETLRYLIPLNNEFQTPLLLKQIYLLWSFIPDDNPNKTQVLTNDDPLSKTFVQTDILDTFNLEKSAKMVMALTLKPHKPGKLSITGIEYSLKAQFSQSESTDYTIRGKQSFSVKGPRYTTIKDMKSGTYGPDFRLEVAVRSSQPKVLELECSNIGHVPLINCLILTLKNLDVIPVPLGNKSLDPGKSIKLRIFIKCPQSLGLHSLKIHFYYENATANTYPKHRILSHQFNVKVIPCLDVKSNFNPTFVYNNSRDQTMALVLNNVTGNNKVLETISVTQIGLISKDKSISNVYFNKGDDLVVTKEESLKLCVNTTLECENDKKVEGFHFSDIKSKSIQGSYSFHSPPYLDFLKTGFHFPPKSNPKLKSDLAVVIWRSGELNGLVLNEIKPAVEQFDEEIATPDIEEVSMSLNEDFESVKTNFPVKVEVKSDPICNVDFDKCRLFRAPFKIIINNLANKNLYIHYKCTGEKNILGCTQGTDVLLKSSSSKILNLKAAITAPGLYHLRGGFMFQVSDMPVATQDPSDLDLVPIDITFIVKNKLSVIE
ncbi:TRAPPC8 [Lepeophtheirus salmonis]|uniref:TRAPPC8 n=1 Tax=Lepeophtheirus salmonis TaxID=72036 RepID=A0A7R8HE40_LEPSM|nr:TRAPPC8 [Lepeophtheirus salmonis]CAF3022783.1 TRAPPC8 [Lepeophtheirus salmonis]